MPDQDASLEFPVAGVNAAGEFERQPPGTAAAAENVRGVEALTTRRRGGSRPGLSKYVATPVDGVIGHPVQMLDAIVDPTVDAVLATFEQWDPPGTGSNPGVTDPSTGTRNPGRLIRPGGSGVQPNRNVDGRRGARHVQSKGATYAFDLGTAGATRADVLGFDQPVRRKSLVVVALSTVNVSNIIAQTQHAVTDSLGLQWHESPGSYEGPYPALANPNYNGAVRLFWAYADFAPGARPLTVTVTTTAVPDPGLPPTLPSCPPLALAILEYAGVRFAVGGSTVALDDSAEFHQVAAAGNGVFTFDAGTPLDPQTNNGLLLGVFGAVPFTNTTAPVAGVPAADPAFTVRIKVGGKSLVVVEATNGLAGTPVTPGVELTWLAPLAPLALNGAFLAASFQRDPG